jgi:hypothetical protein
MGLITVSADEKLESPPTTCSSNSNFPIQRAEAMRAHRGFGAGVMQPIAPAEVRTVLTLKDFIILSVGVEIYFSGPFVFI